MSSPSDNEKSKHIDDEESLSDKESFTDEKNVPKKDRKKKRKSKELLRSPAKTERMKSSPGTSKTFGSNLMVGDSDSSSGEKHVGVVGDNIKHLYLNEGDKLKDSKQKEDLKSTEIQSGIVTSPESQRNPIAESSLRSNNQIVQQPPPAAEHGVIEQRSLIHDYGSVDKYLKKMAAAPTSCEVPNNSLNEPVDSQDLNADLPSTSVAYRRKTYAEKPDDTLDDVSEIVSDFPDIPSDSSLGHVSNQSGRRPSQETSSDAKAEGLSESLESANKSKIAHILSDSSGNKDSKDRGSKRKVEQEITEDVHREHGKSDDVEHDSVSIKLVEPHSSNKRSNTIKTIGKDGNEGNRESASHHCGEQEYGQASEGNKDVTSEQHQKPEEQGSEREEVVDQDVEEAIDDQGGSAREDPSDNDLSESNPAESIEDPDIEQYDMDEESREIDQLDNQENVEQENSNEQGGLNEESEQGSSDYQNFARGRYVGFPIDSTTTDSGIENSSAVFEGNYLVPDNSESNEGSALGSSGAAGFQNLQNWVERGVAAAPLSQSNEGVPGPSNVTEQGGPSTYYASVLSKKILKVAVLETIEDVPMECAEHFAESTSEGSILQVLPEIKYEEPIKDESEKLIACGQRPDSSGTNLGVENENLKVSGSENSPPNDKLSKKTSSGANIQESNPDAIDEENNSLDGEETAANNPMSSLNPKTSQRLAKGDSDHLSSSSQEQSRDGSLADMEDAVDSSDSLSKDAEQQQTPSNLLQTLGGTGVGDSGSKPQGSKRRAKKPGDKNSPFKKRRDTTTACGQQLREVLSSLKPDSDDESSKDGKNVKE